MKEARVKASNDEVQNEGKENEEEVGNWDGEGASYSSETSDYCPDDSESKELGEEVDLVFWSSEKFEEFWFAWLLSAHAVDECATDKASSNEKVDNSQCDWNCKISILIDEDPSSRIVISLESSPKSHKTGNEKVKTGNHKVNQSKVEEHERVHELEDPLCYPILPEAEVDREDYEVNEGQNGIENDEDEEFDEKDVKEHEGAHAIAFKLVVGEVVDEVSSPLLLEERLDNSLAEFKVSSVVFEIVDEEISSEAILLFSEEGSCSHDLDIGCDENNCGWSWACDWSY